MRLYPVFLNLRGRNVLVVGGGPVALRKARGLLRAGARVTVVSPRLASGLPSGAVHARRPYRASDATGKFLVVAATDDPGLNAAVARDARSAGALLNAVDDPSGSDVHVPSVLRRGSLTLAVATGGAAPAVARRIRRELGAAYGPVYAVYLRLLAGLRPRVLREIRDPALRLQVFRRLAGPEFPAVCAREGEAGGRKVMLAVVREAVRLRTGVAS